MGEWSKSVGEFGEATVENFLESIGWINLPQKLTVECVKDIEHGEESKLRHTHGIDFYHSYLSPLADGVRKNIHISSKYTAEVYPNSPSRIVKEFVNDLRDATDCFKLSQKKRELYNTLRGYRVTEDIGLLFYLSNNRESYDDLIAKVASANLQIAPVLHSLYLVDNKRISFISLALRHIRSQYSTDDYSFFYPSTGKNMNPMDRKNYGKVLPIEYINGSILPIRIEKRDGATGIILFSIDPYTNEDLRRLIGLAQELSQAWTGLVEISFPDFDGLMHQESVDQVMSEFSNGQLAKNISVSSYSDHFSTLNSL